MRSVFLAATALFWAAVAAFGWGQIWWPETVDTPAAAAADRPVTLAEVARHAEPGDCWMAIDHVVYDFTAYLPQHPAAPELMPAWCGKDASEAYRTKTKGRPHSPYADQLLPKYRVGRLDA